VAVLLGVGDAKATTALLAKLSKVEALSSLFGRGAQGGVTVTLPGLRPLHTSARGHHLVLSTERGWTPGVASKRPPRWLGTSRATRLLTKPGSSAAGMLDLGLLLRALLARAAVHRPLTQHPYREADVPVSAEYQQKKDELAKLDAQIATQAKRLGRRAIRPQLDLAREAGRLGLRVDRTDQGLVLQARYTTAGRPLTALIAALLREQRDRSDRLPAEESELIELRERRHGVYLDLEAIHGREQLEDPGAAEDNFPLPE
jgi:hypothetical protein